MKTAFLPAAAAGVLISACATMSSTFGGGDNPFYQRSTLAYQLPAFDRIQPKHYRPAFEKGMAEHLAEIDAIARNAEAPGFDNTIVAMEKSGQLLARTSTVFFAQTAANTSEELQAIEAEVSPKLAAHTDKIYLNAALFARVEAVHAARTRVGLNAEQRRLVERYYTDFVRAGARLDAAAKQQLSAINEQLASLTTRFQQNLLDDTNAAAVVVDTREELAGLSDDAIAAAAKAAETRGLRGKYVLQLILPSGQPALAQLSNRALRERLHQASVERANRGNAQDNKATLAQIVKLRAERAALLGHPDHASAVLEVETARTPRAVNELLAKLAPAAVANARREIRDMQKLIDQEQGGFRLQAWDWAYYAERVRKARYAFDESQMKPYFELNRVLQDGAFFMAQKLYGLTFKERSDLPVYHPTVRVFEVFEADGSALGLFLFDPYARPSKQGGAWMNAYVSQNRLFGDKPVVTNHLNIPQPPDGQPTLLTFDETVTLFHEFGHALHGLFSDVTYPYFSGTAVPRDFVEFPSQVHEMWVTWPEVFANYAKHWQTGEPMPRALVDKVKAAEKFNQGFATTEYLAAALLDQAWHQLPPGKADVQDVIAFEEAALKKAGVKLAEVPPRYRSTYFQHIFAGGYSAGYYAYIWSEVLDADTVEWFKDHGGLTRKNGDRFRARLLSKGGSVDAMKLYRDFRGAAPDIQPLLERRGLK